MNRIMRSPRKDVKNYWQILQNRASQYQTLLMYALNKAIDNGDLTDEELIKKLLPSKTFKAYPSIEISRKKIVSEPNIVLSKGRQDIVDSILNSKISNNNKAKEISGIYAEQRIFDALEKKLKDTKFEVKELDKQLTQWDFNIKIPLPDSIQKSTAQKNVLGVLEKYGLVIDHKPDVDNFLVTTNKEYALDNKIWDSLELSEKGLDRSLIERILYEKYFAFQPIFYSNNKGQSKILLPKDFFKSIDNFSIQRGVEKEKLTKEDFIDNGYTFDELQSFTEEERRQATRVVVEEVYKKQIKAYAINYAKRS